MKRWLVPLVLVGSVATGQAWAAKPTPMASMFQEAANAWNVPVEWTQAIAHVESGFSPWSLNIEGKGYRFDSKEKALEKAKEAEAEGLSFDSGVMQVNNFWLKKYGIPLEAAFDPLANIYLGSWILKQEIHKHGQTWSAVGAYHSPNETRGRKYAEMVKDALGKDPARVSAQLIASSTPVEKLTPKLEKKQTDYSPLVVARRDGNQIARSGQQQVNAVPFVQRLNNSKI
ncbi:lytic transglycosylase domain-containing protein [Desulfopila sp. IMCC35006]|uniref:lytic transglycosylase domain-containing protein n=1 Tax=Desulfopila sp. IMCC35006 TaxID=2569542 RepID=UPI0010ABF5F6|nr:lytic transglycosylase domain-containing protein [Desulfopila sp. IMCC35006]TKB23169.1 lytic transglycosylase domain-containing protein [Desulfopila sp. IMCC35006]